jgi:hypothetical protein
LKELFNILPATANYSVFYGEGRDIYDVCGRTAHESVFNVKDGNYRCPNSQQGYSGFTTWTRGLAWAICGFAEELEWFDSISNDDSFPDKENFHCTPVESSPRQPVISILQIQQRMVFLIGTQVHRVFNIWETI